MTSIKLFHCYPIEHSHSAVVKVFFNMADRHNTLFTLNVRGPSYLGLTRSISWLLMPWLLTSPGHQQPCDSRMVLKQEITTAIREVFQWFHANKLSANLTKTSYTVFKNATNTPAYLNSIKIEDTTIKKVPSAKYLGIILDEKLDWKEHIEAVTASLAKITNSLKIVKNFVPHKN